MAGFVEGDVVAMPFPYTDSTTYKQRPVVVIKVLGDGDAIVAMITTHGGGDAEAISLDARMLAAARLDQNCVIRPGRLFTASPRLIQSKRGRFPEFFLKVVRNKIAALFSA